MLVLGGEGRKGEGGGGKMCRGWRGQSIAKCMAKSTPNSTPNSTVNCMAKSMANSMAIPRLISEAKSRKSLEIVEDDKTSHISRNAVPYWKMDDFGGVGVAGEVCACDAMEEVHDNVTELPVVLILGRVGRFFFC